MQLLNIAPKIEAELYLKATNTGLLLHYQSHVDCAIDNSSAENHAWSRVLLYIVLLVLVFEECDRLIWILSWLKYPHRLIDTSISYFVASKAEDQLPISAPSDIPEVRIVLPFKDHWVLVDLARKQHAVKRPKPQDPHSHPTRFR